MARINIYILIGLLITFLPMHSTNILRGHSWNDQVILLFVVLFLLYVYILDSRRIVLNKITWFTFGVFGIISVSYFLSPGSLISFMEYLRLSALIWLVPVIHVAAARRGKHLLGYVLVFALAWQALWGIAHFAAQHDLNMQLIGESHIGRNVPGIAKYSGQLTGGRLVRAYGPYAHANTYGGAMVFGMLGIILARKKRSALTIILSYLFFFGLLVSFSRSAWLSLGVLVLILLYYSFTRKFGKGIVLLDKKYLLIILITSLVFMPLLTARVSDPEDVALTERLHGANYAYHIIRSQPLWQGVGLGQYSETLRRYLEQNNVTYKKWQLAPVHSVPLLLMAELGVVWSLALFCFCLLACSTLCKKKWHLLLPIIPLLLFDHYLLTQTAPLLLLILVLILLLDR